MVPTDLIDITKYWNNKYPNVHVSAWKNDRNNTYCAQMVSYDASVVLEADTIGELINKGEEFLRKKGRV